MENDCVYGYERVTESYVRITFVDQGGMRVNTRVVHIPNHFSERDQVRAVEKAVKESHPHARKIPDDLFNNILSLHSTPALTPSG